MEVNEFPEIQDAAFKRERRGRRTRRGEGGEDARLTRNEVKEARSHCRDVTPSRLATSSSNREH